MTTSLWKLSALAALVLAATATPAAAGDDTPAACAQAGSLIKKKDLVRASIAAGECDALGGAQGGALIAQIEELATAKGYSPVEVVTKPEGGTVYLDDAADETFTTPRLVWMPPGSHEVTGVVGGQAVVRSTVIARNGNRAVVLLELPEPPPPEGPQEVDFGEEGGGEISHGPPPDEKFASLLPERYQRGLDDHAVSWDDPLLILRRKLWRTTVGPLVVATDHGVGWGVLLETQRAVKVADLDPDVWIAPQLAVSVVGAPDATEDGSGGGATVAGHVAVTAQLSIPLGGPRDLYLGLGPSATFAAGADDLAGASVGAVATGELALRRFSLALRVEQPLASSAADRPLGAAVLFGARW